MSVRNSASNPANPSQPLTYPNAQVNNPSIRPDNESYFDDIIRGFRQQALFGSLDYDFIPKTLTATFGTRYYRLEHDRDRLLGRQLRVPRACGFHGPAAALRRQSASEQPEIRLFNN